MDSLISNAPYNELQIGQSASLTRTVEADDIQVYAASSHDTNPAHLAPEYAANSIFKQVIIHGMWSAGLISTLLGTKLPGFGSIYLGQNLQFRRPVHIGDTLTATVTVTEKDGTKKWVTLNCLILNQNNEKVLIGEANILAPTKKITHKPIPVPKVTLD